MTLSDVKPSDALQEGDVDADGGGLETDETGGSSGGRATTPSEVLMSTRPDLAAEDVQRQSGLDLAGSHLVIMVRKMLTALVPSADEDGGMPAIGNGVLAAYHWVLGKQTAGGDDDDDGGDASESEASFRGDDGVALEDRPDYHDPAASGGAPA